MYMTKAKILIIDKCWDCKWFTDNPPHCWEGKRNSFKQLNADIADAMVIDPGCLLADKERMCNWMNQEGYYETSCGKGFFFETGDITDNGFNYCPYCGETITELRDIHKAHISDEDN
jgi:hypothetical protein